MNSKNLETQTTEKNTEPNKVKKHTKKKQKTQKKFINTKSLEKPNDPKTQKKAKIQNSSN